jgi:hypothetical protein
VLRTDQLGDAQRQDLTHLYRRCYRRADRAYLAKALSAFDLVVVSRIGRQLCGFLLGRITRAELPEIGPTNLYLAGMGCVAPELRRSGISIQLHLKLFERVPAENWLGAARAANPVTLRAFTRMPGAVPHPEREITGWHRAVGGVVAELYGAPFDPEHFVCIGDGRSSGHSQIEFEPTEFERKLFEPVQRERGDTLLVIYWRESAPDGWEQGVVMGQSG